MINDQELMFSDAQAITATAASTNVVDLGPLVGGVNTNAFRDIGAGTQLMLWMAVTVAFTDSGSDSTVTVTLETDTDEAFGSAVTIRSFPVFAALTAAGTLRQFKLEPGPYERYIRLNYTLANGNLTTGTISAGINLDTPSYRNYERAYDESLT